MLAIEEQIYAAAFGAEYVRSQGSAILADAVANNAVAAWQNLQLENQSEEDQ